MSIFHKRYVCIKQHDMTDCGAACLAMISKQHGLAKPISKIREIAGTDKIGTSAFGLVKAAEQLGFTAKGVRGGKKALVSGFPLPAIAHVVTPEGMLHYVVIHKITRSKMIIADPGKGLIAKTIDEFAKGWTGVLILLTPTASFQRGGYKSPFARFLKLIVPQRRLLTLIFLASLAITIFGITGSFYFRVLMDTIVPGSLLRTLGTVSFGLIVLYAVKALMEFFRGQLMLYLSQKLDIPLILGYYQHVLGLPMSFFSTRRVGEIVSRFMDASKIRDVISGATLTVMIDTLMAITGGIVLFVQNGSLFAIAFLMAALYGIVVASFNKSIRDTNQKQMEENSQLTSYLVESLNGIDTVKANGAEREAKTKTDILFVRFLKEMFRGGSLQNAQSSITNAIAAIGETAILWVGATFVIDGAMTLGELITFNALLVYFINPIKNLINLQPDLQTAFVAADRLAEIMDLSPETTELAKSAVRSICLNSDIVIRNLHFRYGTRKLVLKDISLAIPRGSTLALVGESGSGKTTLVKLLLRFYDWERGDIFCGRTNIKDVDLTVLRSKIAYVSQDSFFFSGSIRENLLLGNPTASFDELTELCESTGAADFINTLPMRYETYLEENGANLSGGQRQRLSIVRALLKKPELVILDEATSHLDSIAEEITQKTIKEHTAGLTTIVIAHRLSTIAQCDSICVMEGGKIVEQGTHGDLMNRKGSYFDLWCRQMPLGVESGA